MADGPASGRETEINDGTCLYLPPAVARLLVVASVIRSIGEDAGFIFSIPTIYLFL